MVSLVSCLLTDIIYILRVTLSMIFNHAPAMFKMVRVKFGLGIQMRPQFYFKFLKNLKIFRLDL
jgi:hypothetical protein